MTNLEQFLQSRGVSLTIHLQSNAPRSGWKVVYSMTRGGHRDPAYLSDDSGDIQDIRPIDWVLSDAIQDIALGDAAAKESLEETAKIREAAEKLRLQFLRVFTEDEIQYLIHSRP